MIFTVTFFFFIQLMKMKMSCYGVPPYCQKARFEISCLKSSHEQQMKRQDMPNQGSMFEIMSRSVMSVYHPILCDVRDNIKVFKSSLFYPSCSSTSEYLTDWPYVSEDSQSSRSH